MGAAMAEIGQKDSVSRPERALIYDGACRLCVTAKAGLERLGGAPTVRFIPYQSEEAACRLGADYKPGRQDVAFLVEQDGRINRGLDAFLPLLPGLRGGRLCLVLLKLPLMRPLAHLAYCLMARYRYHLFGRVPSKNLPPVRP
jgi:predicted DCC family thiol-disulfide oxidoreductase YuxK